MIFHVVYVAIGIISVCVCVEVLVVKIYSSWSNWRQLKEDKLIGITRHMSLSHLHHAYNSIQSSFRIQRRTYIPTIAFETYSGYRHSLGQASKHSYPNPSLHRRHSPVWCSLFYMCQSGRNANPWKWSQGICIGTLCNQVPSIGDSRAMANLTFCIWWGL